jgi:hypothetical protein
MFKLLTKIVNFHAFREILFGRFVESEFYLKKKIYQTISRMQHFN